jgi:hypothetical protein
MDNASAAIELDDPGAAASPWVVRIAGVASDGAVQ